MARSKKPKPRELLIWDTETTGLPKHPDAALEKQPHIIELGGTVLSCADGKELRKVHWLLKPGIPIPPDSSRVHGLTDADVANAPPFLDAWPEIRAEFEAIDACVAHNSPFDEFMVACELRRIGCKDFKWPENRLCTVGIYRADFGYDPKLLDLYKMVMGETVAQKHRADDDVALLTAIVLKEKLWQIA